MKKILLLHGWDWRNYTELTTSKNAWHNRLKFVNALKKEYEVYMLNFPGFCGEKEPKNEWTLDDYALYVNSYIRTHNIKFDYILGYSFGGAVALKYNLLFNNFQKLILVSPAITRNSSKSIKFIPTPKILKPLRKVVKDLYLKYVVKNEYMINGTKFLNDSYQNIVRVDLTEELLNIKPYNLKIIYGENDNMVNPQKVIDFLPKEYQSRVFVILDGGHDIANTNFKDILKIMRK
ncbi:MAG: alpha/beta fold hydrolase [Bacilli bacterium]|nr:alpha/beta fold hydrolase [Bacilli bacterium]